MKEKHKNYKLFQSCTCLYKQFNLLPDSTLSLSLSLSLSLYSEKKKEGITRDVGTQSTPPYLSSTSPSPASTPSITERSKPRISDSLNLNAKTTNSDEEVCATHFSLYLISFNEFIRNSKSYKRSNQDLKHFRFNSYFPFLWSSIMNAIK